MWRSCFFVANHPPLRFTLRLGRFDSTTRTLLPLGQHVVWKSLKQHFEGTKTEVKQLVKIPIFDEWGTTFA